MLNSLKIGPRLGACTALVGILLLTLLVVGLQALSEIHGGTKSLVEDEWVRSKLAVSALDNARGSLSRVVQLVAVEDKARGSEAMERLRANSKGYHEALSKLQRLYEDREAMTLLTTAVQGAAEYESEYSSVLAALSGGDRTRASTLAFGSTYRALQSFVASLRKLNDYQ